MPITFDEAITKYSGRTPVPLVALARDIGLVVYETEKLPDKVSGLISKDGETYAIFLNSSHAKTRKRFTLAHEIAHFHLHKDHLDAGEQYVDEMKTKTSTLMRNGQTNQIEIEANKLAADILMPEDEFLRVWNESESIEEVAGKFGVSVQAATIRGLNLTGEKFI